MNQPTAPREALERAGYRVAAWPTGGGWQTLAGRKRLVTVRESESSFGETEAEALEALAVACGVWPRRGGGVMSDFDARVLRTLSCVAAFTVSEVVRRGFHPEDYEAVALSLERLAAEGKVRYTPAVSSGWSVPGFIREIQS